MVRQQTEERDARAEPQSSSEIDDVASTLNRMLDTLKEREDQIEQLFGEAKTDLSLRRLRLRGLTGARDEFLLAAIVQNLKRLAAIVAIPPLKTAIA